MLKVLYDAANEAADAANQVAVSDSLFNDDDDDEEEEDSMLSKPIELGRNRTFCLLYTSPSPRDQRGSRMPSSA